MSESIRKIFGKWLLIALLLPSLHLFLFVAEWFEKKIALGYERVRTHQLHLLREIEAFYENEFKSAFGMLLLESIINTPFSGTDPVQLQKIYYEQFFPRLGLKSPRNPQEEEHYFVKLLYVPVKWPGGNKPASVQEVISIYNDMVAECEKEINACLKNYPDREAGIKNCRKEIAFCRRIGIVKEEDIFDLLSGRERSVVDLQNAKDWSLVTTVIRNLINFSLLGGLKGRGGDFSRDSGITDVFEPYISSHRLFRFATTQITFGFHTGNSFADYAEGLVSPPDAFYFGIVNQPVMQKYFLSGLDARCFPGGSWLGLDSELMQKTEENLRKIKHRFPDEGEFSLFRAGLSYILGDEGFFRLWQMRDWQREMRFEILSLKENRAQEDFRIHYMDQLESVRERFGNLVLSGSETEAFFAAKTNSVAFGFGEGKEKYRGFLFRSKSFQNVAFFLYLPLWVAFLEPFLIVLRFLLIMSFTIVLIFFAIKIMHRRIPARLLQLAERSRIFAGRLRDGENVVFSNIMAENCLCNKFPFVQGEVDELNFSCSKMENEVLSQLSDTAAINRLGALVLEGVPVYELILYVSRTLENRMDSELVCLAFWENSPKMLVSRFGYRAGELRDNFDLPEQVFGSDPSFTGAVVKKNDLVIEGVFYSHLYIWSMNFKGSKGTVNNGCFLLLGYRQDDKLPQDRLPFLQSFLSQTVMSFKKTRLDMFKKENVFGHQIQKELLPESVPVSEGLEIAHSFVPARFLGGDFFDYSLYEDQSLAISISDVSGKGIGPALFGASCRGALRALISSQLREPGVILTELNAHLRKTEACSMFATLFLACITKRDNDFQVDYSAAGHNKMFHFSHRENCLFHLGARGLPLGMIDGCDYETKHFLLEQGDWLVLYTDGVTELEDESLRQYSRRRLEEFLSLRFHLHPEELCRELNAELFEFRRGFLPSDDITFILLKNVL
jgi:serine phosphatase RsbU (regulator of sigma subunit)